MMDEKPTEASRTSIREGTNVEADSPGERESTPTLVLCWMELWHFILILPTPVNLLTTLVTHPWLGFAFFSSSHNPFFLPCHPSLWCSLPHPPSFLWPLLHYLSLTISRVSSLASLSPSLPHHFKCIFFASSFLFIWIFRFFYNCCFLISLLKCLLLYYCRIQFGWRLKKVAGSGAI